MDVGALRQVMKRFKQWRRVEDDIKMLTESGGEPVGRVLASEEQERLFKTAESSPEWEHVYCAGILAANTSMHGVEVKHVRRKYFDAGKRVVRIRTSRNETSKRVIPLNDSAFDAVLRMVKRADTLGHTDPAHYLWCASQHHKLDPTKPARKWDTAWRALGKAAGLPGLRFHDLRHTVVTRLLEAGEPITSSNRSRVTCRGECWSTTPTSGSRRRRTRSGRRCQSECNGKAAPLRRTTSATGRNERQSADYADPRRGRAIHRQTASGGIGSFPVLRGGQSRAASCDSERLGGKSAKNACVGTGSAHLIASRSSSILTHL